MELLPAERGIRVSQAKARFDARTLQKHDAAIVVCSREQAEDTLGKLPSATLWQRLYRDARGQGQVSFLSACITPRHPASSDSQSYSVGIRATEARCASTGGWHHRFAPACLLATQGLPRRHWRARAIEAVLAARCSRLLHARHEIEGPEAICTGFVHLAQWGAQLDSSRTVAIDRGNLARWLTALPPNVLNTSGYRVRCAISHAARAGSSISG